MKETENKYCCPPGSAFRPILVQRMTSNSAESPIVDVLCKAFTPLAATLMSSKGTRGLELYVLQGVRAVGSPSVHTSMLRPIHIILIPQEMTTTLIFIGEKHLKSPANVTVNVLTCVPSKLI